MEAVVVALAGGEGVGILGVGIFEVKEVDLVIDAKAAGGEIASKELLLLMLLLLLGFAGEADLSFFDSAEVDEDEPFKWRGITLGGAMPLGVVGTPLGVVGTPLGVVAGDFLLVKESSKTGVVGRYSRGDLSCCCGVEGEGVCLRGVVGRESELLPLVLLLMVIAAAGLTERV